jgi:hypothetical protein
MKYDSSFIDMQGGQILVSNVEW